MARSAYLAGLAYIAVCLTAVAAHRPPVDPGDADPLAMHRQAEAPEGDAGAWFQSVRPFCNPVEVQLQLRLSPPPEDADGTAYRAACLALAGRIDDARSTIGTLPADARWRAAGIVFDVAHPVADAGDDRAAGPIMAMVADFWPNHYMALYHAGMSEYAIGDPAARLHLEAFLKYYEADDGWRRNAVDVLGRLR